MTGSLYLLQFCGLNKTLSTHEKEVNVSLTGIDYSPFAAVNLLQELGSF